MQAYFLTKHAKADEAFELRETNLPDLKEDEVLIKVEAFGLNYADIMARKGMYQDAPKMPCVLGYDVVGTVEEIGNQSHAGLKGKRVVALTRFGGYAQYAVGKVQAVAEVGDLDVGKALAIATQYCTAHYCSYSVTNVPEGSNVLIHAAAGGVGTGLTQIGNLKNCTIFGLTSSDKKLDYLRENGVTHPINYTKEDYSKKIKAILGGNKLDVSFNSVGGSSFKKDMKLLDYGGRIVCFGMADMKGKSIFSQLNFARAFGIYSPIQFFMKSKSVLTVNMLNIADHKPYQIGQSLIAVTKMVQEGVLNPKVGGAFNHTELAKAHEFLESRKSTGKIILTW